MLLESWHVLLETLVPLPNVLVEGTGKAAYPVCFLLILELSVMSEAGDSPWLHFHDNMPSKIAALLINLLYVTALPQGLGLWEPARCLFPSYFFFCTNWGKFFFFFFTLRLWHKKRFWTLSQSSVDFFGIASRLSIHIKHEKKKKKDNR